MAKTFWVETLGCPKNQVDSDKSTGTMLADGMVAGRRRGRGRPRRGQHLRLHRGGPPGVDRHRARPERRPGRRRPGGRDRLHGRALRRRAGRGAARGRLPSPGSVAGFGVPVTLGRRHRSAPSRSLLAADRRCPVVRPARTCPGPVDLAVGLRQGGRGLRPGLRVLRHPELPGPQQRSADILGEADACSHEVDPAASASTSRDRARGPGPGVAYGRDQGLGPAQHRPAGRAVAERVDRVRLLYLYPSDLTDALIDAILATGVPYFDLSLQHVSRPARCGGCADGATATGSSSASPPSGPPSPGPRSARTSSSATPARPRTTTTSCSAFVARGPARLVRVLRLLARGRHLRRRPRRRGGPRADGTSGWPSCASCRTPSPRRDVTNSSVRRVEVLVDAPGVGRTLPGGSRDRRHRHRPRRSRRGLVRRPWWSPARSVPTSSGTGPTPRRPRATGRRGRESAPVSDAEQTYGPSALATPANVVTVIRLLDRRRCCSS